MFRVFAVLLALWGTLLVATGAHAQGYVSRALNHPVPGGVAIVALGQSGQEAPQVTYNKHSVLVMRDSDKQWIAVVGIGLKAMPGSQTLKVTAAQGSRSLAFQVGKKKYREQRITLKNKSQVNPDPEQLKRYEREFAAQSKAYAQFRAALPSNVVLDRPVEGGRLSSPFGLRRFFNGEERNPHSGLDFAVPAGTRVKAPADGVITIVDDYFFNGKTIFIDHGNGLVTMYCHLSAFDVVVGQSVKRGQLIGRVGSTGRATGPHLHWNVSLNNERVDPAIFIGAFQP